MKYLLTAALSMVCAALVQAETAYINYIVPDGYRGPLVLVLHPEQGLELPPPSKPWRLVFDATGRLLVRSASYVPQHSSQSRDQNDRKPRAHYANGKPLPVEGTVPNSDVAFRSVYGVGPGVEQGETAQGAVYFYIGTLDEAKQFESNRKGK